MNNGLLLWFFYEYNSGNCNNRSRLLFGNHFAFYIAYERVTFRTPIYRMILNLKNKT